MTEKPKAWAAAPDHIVVKVTGGEHGFDLVSANELLRDLQSAIWHAEMMARHEQRVRREELVPGDRP